MLPFDELLVAVGEFGPYQKRLCMLSCITGIFFAFLYVGVVFLGSTPAHRCRDPGAERIQELCGWTEEELRRLTVSRSTPGTFSDCQRFDVDWNTTRFSCSNPQDDLNSLNTTRLAPCANGWAFDPSLSTIVSEFQLVCENAWQADLNQAFLNVGLLLGALVIGYGADRYGRKLCFLISIFGLGISGVGMIFSPNYIVLLVIRIIQGVFGKGAWMSAYVLVTEIVGSDQRRLVGTVAQLFFTAGVIILPGIAYLIPSWKTLQFSMSAPCFLFLVYYWFTSSVVYQGLIMRTGIIWGNLHLEFFITGVVELPSALLFYLTVDWLGRRIPFAASNIIGGLSCLATAFIPEDISWLKTTIAVIGRLGITLGFEIVYLISTELYPTTLRNLGVSVVSSLSDIGGIAAPFLLFRLASVWTELPMVLYGLMCLIYGGLVFLLPETKGIDLPESTEDIEALKRVEMAPTNG
ncbi:solute carrier family 22 member 3 isoform X2 [Brienomyrus brachyistius]|uniref:solute carrier family 22 member 3 isoform X2 n=1 Tax=Brienomyrus brachyistius TaxID=42636 RepID=UPI0020B344C1|nr:solute carrier family 22 member 3 isoform X2 [Brienomyrus brachyistius]